MKKLILLFISLVTILNAGQACTSAIVSGKFTVDGRPLLWKHRDNSDPRSKLVFMKDGKYSAIGLVDSKNENATSIWIGINSEGFTIMNTLSYNIEDPKTAVSSRNGVIMKEALVNCASVAEFEEFLNNYPKPLMVQANFGVIDARGGAAYFESNNKGFVKIDVNDKRIAPHGYVVRTNYSFTGDPNMGSGYIRYLTAENLFYKASGSNSLNVPYLLANMCRSLENSYTGEGVNDYLSLSEKENKFFYFQDCINRSTSTSSVVVQGVREGESPLLTTMWAVVGAPLASIAIPVWVNSDKLLPEVITAPAKENSEISEFSISLMERMVPSQRGSTQYYINSTKVFNSSGTGITQQIQPAEREIIKRGYELLNIWREKNSIDQNQLKKFNNWIDEYVRESYSKLFGLKS